MLTQIRNTFTEHGFVIVSEILTHQESQLLKAEGQALIDTAKHKALEAGQDVRDIAGHGVYVGLSAQSQIFRKAVKNEKILDVLQVILSPNIEFLSDKAVFKSHQINFESPWHQDWHYWHGSHKISVWIALDDTTVENGCLKLFPGSHKSAIIHNGEANDDYGFGHRLQPDTVDESKAITAEISAGSGVFFHDLTLHASHPNRTGVDRWVWIPTYRDAQIEDPPYSWATAATVVRGKKKANVDKTLCR